jgi:glycosyltransferase involved in cell wall biosynthesis
MIVGIDYLPAASHAPGIGRYGRELVRALAPLPDRPELRLFAWGRAPRALPADWLGLLDPDGRSWPRLSRFERAWPERLLSLSARAGRGADRWLGGADLFLRMFPDRPPLSRAAAWMPLAEFPPEGSPAEQRLASLARAHAGVLVFSGHGRELAQARLGVDPARLHQVPVGADHWLRGRPPLAAPADPPTVVVLGALRPERLPEEVLLGFERLFDRRRDTRLLLLGPPGGASERFQTFLGFSSARSAVEWCQRPTDPEVAEALRGAAVLLHLSQGEASAVTPLEAAAFGCGLVLSRLPAFVEALGDLPIYVDTPLGKRAGEPIGAALEAALERAVDPLQRQRAQALGAAATWQANAQATLAAWRGAGRPTQG